MEEIFNSLRAIHEGTPPVDYTFWWVWIIVIAVICGILFYSLNRLMPLFEAYKRLTKIDLDDEAFIPLVNYWLKETALIMYPRDTVAPLYGLKWLRFLDSTGGTNFEAFTNAWNTVIYDYKHITVPDGDKKVLVKECKKWLKSNIRRRIWAL
jgi:hypothetical protein